MSSEKLALIAGWVKVGSGVGRRGMAGLCDERRFQACGAGRAGEASLAQHQGGGKPPHSQMGRAVIDCRCSAWMLRLSVRAANREIRVPRHRADGCEVC
jgi:hypothetical protein